jgi:Ca2+-binding RTX toxin-like protein
MESSKGNKGNTVRLGKGDKNVRGSLGDDFLYGNGVSNILRGGAGRDRLKGDRGNDTLEGGVGDDLLLDGGVGNDTILGGLGSDIMLSGNGKDTLWGNEGDDSLEGGNGNDLLYGGIGNDLLLGGNGKDVLVGADAFSSDTNVAEVDILTGGRSKDTFVLGVAAEGTNPASVFYSKGGDADYALITDFTKLDTVQLAGATEDYVVQDFSVLTGTGTTVAGAGIYHLGSTTVNGVVTPTTELVAVLQGVAASGVDLTARNFSYV